MDAWERDDGRVAREGSDAAASTPPLPSSTPEVRVPAFNAVTSGIPERKSPVGSASGLAAHVQSLGWESREFSDVRVTVFGKEYPLHRLVLSRSPYFRALMRGPWADASSPSLTLEFDDPFINAKAVECCLAFLYDKAPEFGETIGAAATGGSDGDPAPTATDSNPSSTSDCDAPHATFSSGYDPSFALRALAASTFLNLDDLSRMCADFVADSVSLGDCLAVQTALDEREYGEHGERAKRAVWGFLRAHAGEALRDELHALKPATLHALLRCDELCVADETARFELIRRIAANARKALPSPTRVENEGGRRALDFHILAFAATLRDGVRYQHVPFDDLRVMKRILEGEEAEIRDAARRRLKREETTESSRARFDDGEKPATRASFGDAGSFGPRGDPFSFVSVRTTRSLLESTPARAVCEGWWTRTALAARVSRSGTCDWARGIDVPFRFSVRFENVRELRDGQGASHSGEIFYAGSLWKISAQAFADEDPNGRRTLGVFLHRRPAIVSGDDANLGGRASGLAKGARRDARGNASARPDALDALTSPGRRRSDGSSNAFGNQAISSGFASGFASGTSGTSGTTGTTGTARFDRLDVSRRREGVLERDAFTRGVSHFVDRRETVDARYELVCPSRHETVRLGSLDISAKPTTLPRAPKGWGWRTALLHEDLERMCDARGTLRVVAAVVLDAAAETVGDGETEDEDEDADADAAVEKTDARDDADGFDGAFE